MKLKLTSGYNHFSIDSSILNKLSGLLKSSNTGPRRKIYPKYVTFLLKTTGYFQKYKRKPLIVPESF